MLKINSLKADILNRQSLTICFFWDTIYSPENFVAFSPISTSTHLTVQKSDRIIFKNCYWSIPRKVARWVMQSDVWNWNVPIGSWGSSWHHFFISGSWTRWPARSRARWSARSWSRSPAGSWKGTRQDSEQGTLPCGNIYLRYALHASNNKAEYEKKKLNLNIMAMKYWLDCQETADISICRIVGGVLYPLPL